MLRETARDEAIAAAAGLPRIEVDQRVLSDAYMLASGGLDPVQRFMNRDQYTAVVEHGRLPEGQPFTIPVVLRVNDAEARAWSGVAGVSGVNACSIDSTRSRSVVLAHALRWDDRACARYFGLERPNARNFIEFGETELYLPLLGANLNGSP